MAAVAPRLALVRAAPRRGGHARWNPRVAGDPGWQLSFAAVAGILVARRARCGASSRAGRPRSSRPPRAARWRLRSGALADGVAITVAATLATAPAARPSLRLRAARRPARQPARAAGRGAGHVARHAQGRARPGCRLPAAAPAAAALGALAGAAGRAISRGWPSASPTCPAGGRAAARLPGRRGGGATPLLAAARWRGVAAAAAAAPRSGRRARGALARACRGRGGAALRRGALAVAARRRGAALDRPGPPDRLTVRFLDVGQGDATLIQHPDGTAVLFDGGPPEAGVARLLRRAGRPAARRSWWPRTRRATTTAACPRCSRRFPVGVLLDGGDGTADPAFRALEREADGARRPAGPGAGAADAPLAGGDLAIDVLSPPPRPPGPAPEDPNPRAVVAVVSERRLRPAAVRRRRERRPPAARRSPTWTR